MAGWSSLFPHSFGWICFQEDFLLLPACSNWFLGLGQTFFADFFFRRDNALSWTAAAAGGGVRTRRSLPVCRTFGRSASRYRLLEHRRISINVLLMEHKQRRLSINVQLLEQKQRRLSINVQLLEHKQWRLSINVQLLEHKQRWLSINDLYTDPTIL